MCFVLHGKKNVVRFKIHNFPIYFLMPTTKDIKQLQTPYAVIFLQASDLDTACKIHPITDHDNCFHLHWGPSEALHPCQNR